MQNLAISHSNRAQPRPGLSTFVQMRPSNFRPAKPEPRWLTRAQLREIIIEQLG